ncbi:MAG: hypothetical protein IRZ28_10615 [Steroidobacteraceae bacterium]|nr:hypothetical protein [Steroidobacteraceae bacterium]
MAFVNESIDTPERIREFDALNLISPVAHKPAERWRWAVDRERGFYFVKPNGFEPRGSRRTLASFV